MARVWVAVAVPVSWTLETRVDAARLQFHADRVGRFEPGPVTCAGPTSWRAAAISTRGRAAPGDPVRAPDGWGAPSVLPGVGAPAGRLPRTRAGVLQPAPGRGLSDHPGRLGDPRCSGRTGRNRPVRAVQQRASADRRLSLHRARSVELPTRRLGL